MSYGGAHKCACHCGHTRQTSHGDLYGHQVARPGQCQGRIICTTLLEWCLMQAGREEKSLEPSWEIHWVGCGWVRFGDGISKLGAAGVIDCVRDLSRPIISHVVSILPLGPKRHV